MSDLHTLPERPVFAFCPAYEPAGEPQPIRIVFAGVPGYVPTAPVALRNSRPHSHFSRIFHAVYVTIFIVNVPGIIPLRSNQLSGIPCSSM